MAIIARRHDRTVRRSETPQDICSVEPGRLPCWDPTEVPLKSHPASVRSGHLPAALVSLALGGCGGGSAPAADSPADPALPRIGASIAVLASGDVAVVNPDVASVSVLSARTLDVLRTVPVGAEPRTLLELPNGHLLVASRRGGELTELDPGSGKELRRMTLCAGPFGLAASEDWATVAVSCEWEGTVISVDVDSFETGIVARGLVRPRPIAFAGGGLFVGEYTRGTVAEVDGGRLRRTSLVPGAAPYRPAVTDMTSVLVSGFAVSDDRILVAHQLVNHDGNATAEPVADDYGSAPSGNAKLNPAVSEFRIGSGLEAADPPALYARFDGGTRAFSQPSAVVFVDAHTALVANQSTKNVAVLDLDTETPGERAVASYGVADGPSGIALDRSGRRAFVDDAYDGSVAVLDLGLARGPDAPVHVPALTRRRELAAPYSDAALAGRKLFHDATNPHVTPLAVLSCGNCHPEGGEDGLVWFAHTSVIPTKRRRTPDLATAKTGTAPFHWDGQFASIADLVQHTMTDLMAGDGAGIDADSIRAYIDEIVEPPVPAAKERAAVARGRAVFELRGCNECHAGKNLTDGALHVVLTPMSLTADDVVRETNTPDLHGVFLRAPYFHDGRSPSLEDSLIRRDAGFHGGPEIPDADRADLVTYLESL